MPSKLSREDYSLLDEMSRQGGVARISGGRPRHGADRLVDAGFAVSRALNMSDVEYQMTPLGRKAHVLKRHGIASTEIETIEPHRHDVDGLWYIKVSCWGDPAVMMSVGAADKLLADLRTARVHDVAETLEHELERARRFARSGM
jgi:hypothetical protein